MGEKLDWLLGILHGKYVDFVSKYLHKGKIDTIFFKFVDKIGPGNTGFFVDKKQSHAEKMQ